MTELLNDLETLGSIRGKLNEVVNKTNGSTLMQATITGGSINGTPVGQGTPAAGAFTNATAQNLTVSGQSTIASATINGPVGLGGTNYGTAGQALLSAGPGAAPTWGTLVPSGIIAMWSGSVASIPAGWRLCNGQNGTPDLRDRFVVGAGSSYTPGDTGGANSVTLTASQMPTHQHSFSGTTSWTGDHQHATVGTAAASNGNAEIRADNFGGGNIGAPSGSYNRATQPAGGHNHTFGGVTDASGSGAAHENRPPYYALCFIMKT